MSRQIGYGEPVTDEDAQYLRDHNDPRGFTVQADEVEAAGAGVTDVQTSEDEAKPEPKARAKK